MLAIWVGIKPQRDMYQKDLNMEKIKKLIALTAVMTLFAGQVQGQDQGQDCCNDCSEAYQDCGNASYLSAALPIGAIAVAAIIIATTNRNHHHHSSSSSSRSSCTSSHSHCHSSSSSSSSCSSF
jgi:hypothetical protein